MKEKLYTAALIGGMAAAGSSIGCENEVIYPETYNLDFDTLEIPCGNIDEFTPYDKSHYCEGAEDDKVVTIDAFYDASEETRAKITAAVVCVLETLSRVTVEMKSDRPEAVLAHIGGFGRLKAGGASTYDEGNRNRTKDNIYVADRLVNPETNNVVYFSPEMTSLIIMHEIGHTLGLEHGSADSIMAGKIDHSKDYPFYFTRAEAELLLENTHDQTTEEKIEGLTNADERCDEELSALKAE